MDEKIYFDKRTIEILKKQFENISPSTWHKIMNPFCPQCLEERGREIVERIKKGGKWFDD